MDDQKIKLTLDYAQSKEETAALKKQTEDLKAALDLMAGSATKTEAATYELAVAESEYEVVAEKVVKTASQSVPGLSAVEHAMAELAVTSKKAAIATEDVGEAVVKTTGKSSAMQQRITAASYAFQDFTSTSGDLGAKLNSVTNNLTMIVGATGPVGIAIATAAVAGIALYRSWDSISALWENRTPIEGVKDSLDALEKSLTKNNDALDKMREKEVLNATQMIEFNRLTKETADLEKQVAEQREIEAARKSHTELSNEVAKGRAAGAAKAVDELGGFDAVVAQLMKDYETRFGKLGKEAAAVVKHQTEDILTKAMKGDKGALDFLAAEGAGPKGGQAARDITDLTDAFDPDKTKRRERVKKAEEALTTATMKQIEKATKAEEEKEKEWNKAIDISVGVHREMEREAEAAGKKTTARVTRAGAAFGRDVAVATREVEKSNIDEQADAAAASLRAAGGYTNARGQFVKQDEDQQRQTVIEDVMKQIRQQFPNMGKMQAQGVASKIADKSFAEVDRMTAQGMDAIGTTQANLLLINAELMNEMGRINTKLRKVGGASINQVDRLRSDARSRVPGT